MQARQKTEMYVGGLAGCRGDACTGFDFLPFEEAKGFHGEKDVHRTNVEMHSDGPDDGGVRSASGT